ncbi:competence/damage-inducible protein A [Halonatronum saccharophilum]|uniref:competence/damage-inducible protein A n=1 Tax=Halonatronum saccharophilum TaxID=150060 RepID=UPI000488DBD4|nr:competence/damage-inducible protein A [Halonatronum saccharophilum]
MRAEVISIGTELLLGQIVDTNAQWIAQRLAEIGVDLYRKVTVGDNKDRIVSVLKDSLSRANIIITTGGLGPTQDDLTRESVAQAFGVKLVEDKELLKKIENYFTKININMAKTNKKQAFLPQGADPIVNSQGTAPGILFKKGDKIVVSLPGVPIEMKAMMEESIIPFLKGDLLENEIIESKVIKLIGIGESSLEEQIDDILKGQTNPTVAPLASAGEVKLRLTAKANDREEARRLITKKEKELEERIGEYIYGYNDDSLDSVVARLLWAKDLKIATAESCTGGLIGDRLTSIPGSSRYYDRGLITYSNKAKIDLLGVKEETLNKYGAVSKETAKEMALGVKERSGVDIGIATTGIAGPGGGSEKKPVGLVYMGIAYGDNVETYKYNFNGSREKVKYLTSQTILNLLRLKLINS